MSLQKFSPLGKLFLKTFTATLLVATAPCMFTACSHSHEHEHEHEHGEKEGEEEHHHGIIVFTKEQMEAGGVETGTVEMSGFQAAIPCSGQILSASGEERTITSPLAGVVTFAGTALTPGEAVNSGERLFNISASHIVQPDPSPELKSALQNAEAALRRAHEQFESRLITKAEYDAAVADVNNARAALRNPGASPVKHASASSPISGFVTECMVRSGDYVEIGSPLAVISTDRRLQLRADVPQKYASSLSGINGANIIFPDNPDIPVSLSGLNASVVSYGKNSADGVYVPVIIEFDNPGGMLAGSVAEVYLLGNSDAPGLTVPRSALTEEEGIYFVYVEESPEHYRKQQVSRGRDNGKEVEIISGLKEGDKIVTKGATLLKLAANSGKAPQGHTHNH